MIRGIIKYVESFVAKRALLQVVPGNTRDFTKCDNVRVLRNSPVLASIERAREISGRYEKFPGLTIYVNGWLVSTRGVEFILQAIQHLQGNFKVYLAGNLACDAARKLALEKNVEYLGILDVNTALSYYFVSDVVLCFYDPSIEINRLAEPNKWYDCLVTGVPFMTNDEVATAKPYRDAGVCLAVPYGDAVHLKAELERLINDRQQLGRMRENLLRIGVKPWDVAFAETIKEALDLMSS